MNKFLKSTSGNLKEISLFQLLLSISLIAVIIVYNYTTTQNKKYLNSHSFCFKVWVLTVDN